MARLKLVFPEPVLYTTDLEVRVDDINYGGHVGNDRFLTLAQEARVRLFRNFGYNDEAHISENTGIIVADAAVMFKSELFLGDTVRIEISISDRNKYGFDFFYRITNAITGKLSAVIKTGVVGYDYVKGKIVQFPEEFFRKMETDSN